MSPEMLELLLADPILRPRGGWSERAEEWTDANQQGDWRTVYALRKSEAKSKALKSELDGERQEVLGLTAEVEVLRRRQPDLLPVDLPTRLHLGSISFRVRTKAENPRRVRGWTEAMSLGFVPLLHVL